MPTKYSRFFSSERLSNLHYVTQLVWNWDLNPEPTLLTTILLSGFISLLKYLDLHCKFLGKDCVLNLFVVPGELSKSCRRQSVSRCFTDL